MLTVSNFSVSKFAGMTDVPHMIEHQSSMEERGEEMDIRYDGLHESDQDDFFRRNMTTSSPTWPSENSDPRLGSYLLTENYMMEVARRPSIWRDAPASADGDYPPRSGDDAFILPYSADQSTSNFELGAARPHPSSELHQPHATSDPALTEMYTPNQRERFTTFVT